jgi:hypothetical protein
MFGGQVENTSGIQSHEIFSKFIEFFQNLTIKEWGVFVLGIFAVWFIREGIPMILIKMGVKGLEEEREEN